jgi:hypothetical protein
VDESGEIRTDMGSRMDQKMAAVHGALCIIPPRNSNRQPVTQDCHLGFLGTVALFKLNYVR